MIGWPLSNILQKLPKQTNKQTKPPNLPELTKNFAKLQDTKSKFKNQ